MALILTLLIHEAGHAAAAFSVGAPALGIRTRPGGLLLLCRADMLSYPRAAFVYAGGAAANLLTAAFFPFLPFLPSYSVGAAVYNLLPLPGADGTKILSALLSMALPDVTSADRIVSRISDVCVVLFWCASVYLAVTGQGGGIAVTATVIMLVIRFSGE